MSGGRRRRGIGRGLGVALGAAWLWLGLAPAPAAQTETGIAYVNQERMLAESALGRALLAEEEAAREALRAEARRIDAEFEAEEQRLTELRSELDPAEFRALADDFDRRAVTARREQDMRSAELFAEFEQRRRLFYSQALPVLVEVMQEMGAAILFDETAVLLADQSLSITDQVIARLDALYEADAIPPPANENEDASDGDTD